ncbi:MAG: hypothetical protein ACE5KS_04220 [Woeseiaceae bacterium]
MLPAAMDGRIRSDGDRRWLSRASLNVSETPLDIFARVLQAVGLSPVEEGLAALRFWGQTGDRPSVWIAAADPIHLEAMLDHVRLHALTGSQSPKTDVQAIFDFLQDSLGEDMGYAFARVGKYGYLRSDRPIATASVSAAVIDGMQPEEFMPAGESAAAYHKLTGELQMSLHEHEVNLRREAQGLLPVNAVWLWGGGMAPDKKVKALPPLFGDDPVLKGYWESRTGLIEPWPGTIDRCLDIAVKDFVVVTPESEAGEDALASYFAELRQFLKAGRLRRLLLIFRDGLTAEVGCISDLAPSSQAVVKPDR